MSSSKTTSPAARSETTLTPAVDGISDYQQYLEKTSRNGSSLHTRPHGESSLANSHAATGDTETPRPRSMATSNSPVETTEIQPEATATSSFKEVKPGPKRKQRKRRLHRVEAAEDPYDYPGPLALGLLTIGICLSVFLVSLDRTIVATVSRPHKALPAKLVVLTSSSRQYHALQTTSIPTMTSAGTAARTLLQLVLCSQYTAEYSHSST